MIVTYKVSNKGTSSVWYSLQLRVNSCNIYERRTLKPRGPLSPPTPPSPSPPLGVVGQLRQRAPSFPRAEAEGSPAGILGCLQHTFLTPVMYKAESWSILNTPNPHSDHLSTCTSDRRPQEKCTRNQIMAIDRQSGVSPCSEAGQVRRRQWVQVAQPSAPRPGRPHMSLKRSAPVTIPRLEIGNRAGNTSPEPPGSSAGPPGRGGGVDGKRRGRKGARDPTPALLLVTIKFAS